MKASISANELQLHHYHHLLLKYDLTTRRPTYQWHEKPTDKRFLLAALDTLKEEADRLQSKFNGASSSGAGSEAAGQKRKRQQGSTGSSAIAAGPTVIVSQDCNTPEMTMCTIHIIHHMRQPATC